MTQKFMRRLRELPDPYEDLARERIRLSIACAKAEVEFGPYDPRYLEAFDAYLEAAQIVDEIRAKGGGK